MKISVVTYNTSNNISALSRISEIVEYNDADCIFIALQEMFNINDSLFVHKKGYIASYTKMIGMVSILLTKDNCHHEIVKIGLGFLGFPNKGFILHKIKKTILINCHLPAHEHKHRERMEMIDKIFGIVSCYKDVNTIIVAGDMNFRIRESEESRKLLENREYGLLKLRDQSNTFFEKYRLFSEGVIEFKPTFKYIVGRDQYDSKRFPSWCDRILHASKYNKKVVVYKTLNYTFSDHRPVYGEIEISADLAYDGDILANKKVFYYHRVLLTHFYCLVYDRLAMIMVLIILTVTFVLFKKMYKPTPSE